MIFLHNGILSLTDMHPCLAEDDIHRRYVCGVCSYRASSSSNLQRHRSTHTNVKPFQCDICRKCFRQKSHLTQHRRSIHDVRVACGLFSTLQFLLIFLGRPAMLKYGHVYGHALTPLNQPVEYFIKDE